MLKIGLQTREDKRNEKCININIVFNIYKGV